MSYPAHKAARPAAMRRLAAIADPGELWKLQAKCAGHPRPDIFHPPPARQATPAQLKRSQAELRRRLIIAEAKQVCAQCLVQRQCLAYATARDDRYGIWGGLTSAERGYEREDR